MRKLLALILCLMVAPLFGAVDVTESTTVTLYKGTSKVRDTTGWDDCRAQAKSEAAKLTAGSVTYSCKSEVRKYAATYAPDPSTCAAQPAAEVRVGACPTGTTGTWTQTRTYSSSPYPTCWTAGDWLPASAPAGACTAVIVTPPPSTGSSGSLTQGATATVTGSGFGATGPKVLLWDDFETGSDGAIVQLSGARVGKYSTLGGVKYTSADKHSGKLAALHHFGTGQDQYSYNEFRALHFQTGVGSGGKLYVSWYFKINGGSGGQLKQFQLWGNPYSSSTYGPGFLISAGVGLIMTDGNATYQEVWHDGTPDKRGAWQRWEVIAQQDSTPGASDGRVTVNVGEHTVYNVANTKTRDSGSSRSWGEFHEGDGHTNASSYADFLSDELYAQIGWQRVLLSSTAAIGPSSIVVPQVPTSWADGSISFTVERGALASGQVYVLVFDPNGKLATTSARTLN